MFCSSVVYLNISAMKSLSVYRLQSLVIVTCFLFSACKPTISVFDSYAYTQSTAVKVDVMNLMKKATETYTSQQTEVDALDTRLQKIYEYEKHRPKNGITLRMWDIL